MFIYYHVLRVRRAPQALDRTTSVLLFNYRDEQHDVDWMIRRGHESPGPGQYLSETKVGKIRTNMTTCTHTCSHTNSLARTCSHAHSHTDSHVIALCRHACTEENFRRVIPNLRWIGKSTVPSRLIILLERLTTTSQD